jgi:hypothetical protein
MDGEEFIYFQKKLGRTQKEIAQLLGTFHKAVQGYEQGWRSIPVHVERHVFFLVAARSMNNNSLRPCWETRDCPSGRWENCPAWEFRAGRLCWFINGTICEGIVQRDWKEKINICRACEVFVSSLRSKKEGL